MSELDSESSDVLVSRVGMLGRITLNRPGAINALTLDMLRQVDAALDWFEADPDVTTVLLDGAGDRGFCAGGDIRSFHEATLTGDRSPITFFTEEYAVDARIARFPKPVVVIMDGITMGGGVGLGGHAWIRVVTERSRVALPEVGIGLVPDVGGTWLLSRPVGEIGTHVALTAAHLGAADAITVGLADHFIESGRLPDLVEALSNTDARSVVDRLATAPAESGALAAHRAWIDDCYAGSTVDEILENLESHADPAAQAAAEAIRAKSPTAVVTTLRALREARHRPSLEACLEVELRTSSACLDIPDFQEGIRAAVVDKDRNPRWNPATFAEVDVGWVDAIFATPPDA